MEPSAGSFITYVETSLGPKAGVVTALLITVGFTVAIAGVFTMAGGMISLTLEHYTSWHPSWVPIALVMTAAAIGLTLRGAGLSTTAVGVAMVIQVLIMIAVCVVVLVDRRSHLSATPFSWSHLNNGLAGLSAGFPLALYMLIGWENAPALAEETRDPRRTIPRAHVHGARPRHRAVRPLRLHDDRRLPLRHLLDRPRVGAVSGNGRPLPRRRGDPGLAGGHRLGALHAGRRRELAGEDDLRRRPLGAAAGGARQVPPARRDAGQRAADDGGRRSRDRRGLVALSRHRSRRRDDDPVNLYAECSTMGTILVLFVYVLTAVSLPVFMWRRHRDSFSVLRYVAMPALGALALVIPFIELFHPGQPVPYSVFPYLSVAILSGRGSLAQLRGPTQSPGGRERGGPRGRARDAGSAGRAARLPCAWAAKQN